MIFRGIFVRMRNVSERSCRGKTHFMFRNFSSENLAVYDKMGGGGIKEPDRPQVTI
jgi:hypothetical protein